MWGEMTSGKKVLIVEENSYVPLDRRVWYEATTLRDAGWQVAVVCPLMLGGKVTSAQQTGNPQLLEGIRVYRFPLKVARRGIWNYLREYLTAIWGISRLSWQAWRDDHFDVIQFCNPPDLFAPLALLYRMLGARAVFDHHDLFPELVQWRFRGPVRWVLRAFALVGEFTALRSANVVISTNESYRRVATDRAKVPPERVVVVRNGPKREDFAPVAPVPDLKRGFPYMAAYAGVMGPEDGVTEVMQSIHYITHELGRRDILFVLMGDGAVRSKAQADAAAWGLEDVVVFTGMIHDNLLLRQHLCTADVLLSPEPKTPLNMRSTFIKVAEYMAMSKPVVAYRLPETQYTAREAAVFVEPGDAKAFGQAILALLDDPERRRQMGQYGRKRVLECLTWESQQVEFFRAYAIALGAKTRAASAF